MPLLDCRMRAERKRINDEKKRERDLAAGKKSIIRRCQIRSRSASKVVTKEVVFSGRLNDE